LGLVCTWRNVIDLSGARAIRVLNLPAQSFPEPLMAQDQVVYMTGYASKMLISQIRDQANVVVCRRQTARYR